MEILKRLPVFEIVYFEQKFMMMLESHLTRLKNNNIRLKTIDNHFLEKYKGDLYGLLDEIGVPKHYHYITMRVNNMLNSSDYDSHITLIKLPDFVEIESLKNIYMTKR